MGTLPGARLDRGRVPLHPARRADLHRRRPQAANLHPPGHHRVRRAPPARLPHHPSAQQRPVRPRPLSRTAPRRVVGGGHPRRVRALHPAPRAHPARSPGKRARVGALAGNPARPRHPRLPARRSTPRGGAPSPPPGGPSALASLPGVAGGRGDRRDARRPLSQLPLPLPASARPLGQDAVRLRKGGGNQTPPGGGLPRPVPRPDRGRVLARSLRRRLSPGGAHRRLACLDRGGKRLRTPQVRLARDRTGGHRPGRGGGDHRGKPHAQPEACSTSSGRARPTSRPSSPGAPLRSRGFTKPRSRPPSTATASP